VVAIFFVVAVMTAAIFCRRWRAAAVMVLVVVMMVLLVVVRPVVGEGTTGALSAVAHYEVPARRRRGRASADGRGRAPCVWQLVVAVAALVARAAEALRKVPARPSLFLPLHSFFFSYRKPNIFSFSLFPLFNLFLFEY
jgi:hypothetical protein